MRTYLTSPCRRAALAVLAGFLLSLASCHRATTQPEPLYIMLTFNAGTCQQNGSYGVIDVYQNQAVIYQNAAVLPEFQVRFAACPFASCPVNSPNGTSMNVGQPNSGTVGTTFNYTGMSINNQPCNDAEAMGVRIMPAP
ncbi:MAG: hypothetical protein ABSD98_07595 [Candidatus Korobacteraceae bacterium]|jgi:hypothetical protein